jgi:hypothetical protein
MTADRPYATREMAANLPIWDRSARDVDLARALFRAPGCEKVGHFEVAVRALCETGLSLNTGVQTDRNRAISRHTVGKIIEVFSDLQVVQIPSGTPTLFLFSFSEW